MTFTRQKEIDAIIAQCQSFEELNRVTRLIKIYSEELSKASQTVFIIGSKVDKLAERIFKDRETMNVKHWSRYE